MQSRFPLPKLNSDFRLNLLYFLLELVNQKFDPLFLILLSITILNLVFNDDINN